jgi:DNA-binding transcriptional LysR family regulator
MASLQSDLFVGVVPFVAAAQAGSYREAAAQLGLTPSALSKAISRLEQELGVVLLARSTRGVAVTDEGALFLASCQEAVAGVARAREGLADMQRAPRGKLSVSVPLILGQRVVLPALAGFLERHPGLSVHVGCTDRFVSLEDAGVDVALRIGAMPPSRLPARKLRTVRWLTVAAPSYLARRGVPQHPSELDQHDCLAFVRPNGTRQAWQFVQAEAKPPRTRLTSDHGQGLIDAARAGVGLFQAHDYAVADALSRGELVEVLAPFSAPGPALHLLLAAGKRKSPKVRAFVDFILPLTLAPQHVTRLQPASAVFVDIPSPAAGTS